MSVGEAIIGILSTSKQKSMRPIDLARATGYPKNEINRALYGDVTLKDRVERVGEVPPLWALKEGVRVAQDKEHIHVLVDLGNIHDCLKRTLELANHYERSQDGDYPKIFVHGYADWAYNGSERKECAEHITQATHNSSHAADIAMIWDACELLRSDTPVNHIIFASRDKFVHALADHVKSLKHAITVDVVANWDELRQLIEY